jgi:2-polyprenyl-3-methyl-5-hydroxy-6-metoxy-1,4-benzoquinol methylase
LSEKLEKYFDHYFQQRNVNAGQFNIAKMGRKDRGIAQSLIDLDLNNKKCLDIGPGTGRWVQFLKTQTPGYIAAADISNVALEHCGNLCDKTQKIDISCEQLDWPKNFFDVILSIEIIEHLVDSEHFVSEVVRVLKPGGVLLLTTPNIISFISRIRLVCGMMPVAIACDETHVRFFRRQELRKIFHGQPVKLQFLPTSFSLHPLRPKSVFRIPTFGMFSALDDSLLLKVEKKPIVIDDSHCHNS